MVRLPFTETDTVAGSNRFSRFPVVNQHRGEWGVVTIMLEIRAPRTTLLTDVAQDYFTTNLSTSITTISQQMIAEDYKMIPVVRNNQTLLGIVKTSGCHGSD